LTEVAAEEHGDLPYLKSASMCVEVCVITEMSQIFCRAIDPLSPFSQLEINGIANSPSQLAVIGFTQTVNLGTPVLFTVTATSSAAGYIESTPIPGGASPPTSD